MKMLICGDFTATSDNRELFEKKDVARLFGDTLDIFERADRVFVNVECAITNSNNTIKKYGPCIKTPVEAAQALKKIGVTDCGISNNHIFDYGIKGLEDTVKALTDAGLNVTGYGLNYDDARKNLYFSTPEGKRCAIIAVCDREYSYALENRIGARAYDDYDTMLDIAEAKRNADFVIVIYHGGKEFSRYPSPRLRKSCHAMVMHGANAVICQHTHCIGSYEKFNGAHILYGQGNFHFVEYDESDGWNSGLLLMLDIKEKIEIEFIPVVINDVGIEKASDKESDEILRDMERRNKSLLTEEWKKGWHAVCERYRDIYENAVKNTYMEEKNEIYRQVFAHYIDCQAHLDVLQELFFTWNKTNEL